MDSDITLTESSEEDFSDLLEIIMKVFIRLEPINRSVISQKLQPPGTLIINRDIIFRQNFVNFGRRIRLNFPENGRNFQKSGTRNCQLAAQISADFCLGTDSTSSGGKETSLARFLQKLECFLSGCLCLRETHRD